MMNIHSSLQHHASVDRGGLDLGVMSKGGQYFRTPDRKTSRLASWLSAGRCLVSDGSSVASKDVQR